MIRATLLGSALITTLASAPHAEEHEIVMLGLGYFPETTHAAIGDTVTFLNVSDTPMMATATDGSWTTGLVGNGETVSFEVLPEMTGSFANVVTDTEALDPAIEEVDGIVDETVDTTTGLPIIDSVVEVMTDLLRPDQPADSDIMADPSLEQVVSTVEAYGYIDYTNPAPLGD